VNDHHFGYITKSLIDFIQFLELDKARGCGYSQKIGIKVNRQTLDCSQKIGISGERTRLTGDCSQKIGISGERTRLTDPLLPDLWEQPVLRPTIFGRPLGTTHPHKPNPFWDLIWFFNTFVGFY
jgi:hypothetical protein